MPPSPTGQLPARSAGARDIQQQVVVLKQRRIVLQSPGCLTQGDRYRTMSAAGSYPADAIDAADSCDDGCMLPPRHYRPVLAGRSVSPARMVALTSSLHRRTRASSQLQLSRHRSATSPTAIRAAGAAGIIGGAGEQRQRLLRTEPFGLAERNARATAALPPPRASPPRDRDRRTAHRYCRPAEYRAPAACGSGTGRRAQPGQRHRRY